MLLKFKVENFRSIDGMQELNMLSGSTRSKSDHVYEKGDVHVLKNTVIYGANAAGKSAFVNAIEVSKLFVMYPVDTISNIKKSYCRINDTNKKKRSYFEYIVSISDRFYSYGFEVVLSEARIVSEWLIRLNNRLEEDYLVFQRDAGKEKPFVFGKIFKDDDLARLNTYAFDMEGNRNKMFLSEMSTKNIDEKSMLHVFRDIFGWFEEKLYVNMVRMPNKKSIMDAGNILKDMDTDISAVSFREISKQEYNSYDPNILNSIGHSLREGARKGKRDIFIDPNNWVMFELKGDGLSASKVCTIHGSSNNQFEINEESTGTKEILSLISILSGEEDDVTFIQDEFGNGLHPNLSYRFMELFQQHNRNRSCQLIVTTHEVLLMTLDLFRRDEIWFVEKSSGRSSMYSLEEFKERFDKKLSKAYLEGRYGALPIFKDMIEG